MVVCDVGEVGECWCELDEQVPSQTPDHHSKFGISIFGSFQDELNVQSQFYVVLN